MTTTPIADMIEAMLAKDTPPEIVVLAVRTIELSAGQSRDSHVDKLESRRVADRLRKQKQRQNQRNIENTPEANDAGARADSHADSHVTVADKRCDSSSSLLPVLLPKQSIQKERETRARGTRLPADWQPTDELVKFAQDNGLEAKKFRDEFVDFWIGVPGARGLKTDWPATWRNRVRAVSGQTGAPNGQRGSRTLQDDRLSVSKAADRLIDATQRGEFTIAPRPSLLPDESQGNLRLLPKG